MHAQAGTIGYELIHDEEARKAAKQASRERAFGRAAAVVRSYDDDPTVTGGTSTPSTAASPHDAEAAREQERLKAAEHLRFLALVRAWADGADLRLPNASTPQEVRKLVETFEHLSRQAGVPAAGHRGWYYAGKADTWEEAAELLKAALA